MPKARKITKSTLPSTPAPIVPEVAADRLLGDIRGLIEAAREQTARAVNSALVGLNWQIGTRIREDVLRKKRAEYGAEIVSALGRQLTQEYGRGFSEKSLWHMMRFAEVFPDEQIVSALRRQLSWTHFKEIIYLDDPLKRDFYAEMCRIERWSTRTLRQKIGHLLFERTAVSKKPDELIAAGTRRAARRGPDDARPGLPRSVFAGFPRLERHLRRKGPGAAILRELEAFILELGIDFAFVARQKRITVDSEDYYLDLLFYHRRLRRLVAIDLKLGEFQAADKGQMELYLRWLEKHERGPARNRRSA